MFTGLVEELGRVIGLKKGQNSARIILSAQKVLKGTVIGDSIAVNGVCLTVVEIGRDYFQADVMMETLGKSSLGDLKSGDRVNLERAVRLGDRLGGHMVSGHIDGVGTVGRQEKLDIALLTEIMAPAGVLKYMIPKGSIAIDGVSLTIVDVKKDRFTVSLIPHSAKMTTLGYKKSGDTVNLEGDMIGKYVERLMFFQENERQVKKSSISLEYLAEHGFS
ncbi:riboflavin synthase [Dehalobacterium formicoaceticum]|uniref:Riboflavin synthase n=1 Tax=Dehalobacterium formicoaceticum TaxID=51515 RepID=A0ABT1Y1B4_9FIRM|nr:riboflavin synthase [Dehalobacterium formicoaceticum]MCR6544648.1 riboflavin synthase [Dehalobacterium formicoaceticum]